MTAKWWQQNQFILPSILRALPNGLSCQRPRIRRTLAWIAHTISFASKPKGSDLRVVADVRSVKSDETSLGCVLENYVVIPRVISFLLKMREITNPDDGEHNSAFLS
jgi:hypothetical protein